MPTANPFNIGYYPGDKPIYKKPPRVVPPAPIEFDTFGGFLRQFDYTVSDSVRWLGERYRDDLDGSFNASLAGSGMGEADLQLYGPEAADDLPGSQGIKLSLNPADWAEPGKQAKKTLTGWARSIADFDDIDARARKKLWNEALSDPVVQAPMPFYTLSGFSNLTKNQAVGAIKQSMSKDWLRYQATNGTTANPLSFDNVGIIYKVKDNGKEKDVDAYKDVKDSVLKFQISAPSVSSREKNFDGVLKKSVKALKVNFDQDVEAVTNAAIAAGIDVNDATFDAVAEAVKAKYGQTYTNVEDVKLFLKSFNVKAQLLDDIGGTGKKVGKAVSALDKYVVSTGRSGSIDAAGKVVSAQAAKEKAEKGLKALRNQVLDSSGVARVNPLERALAGVSLEERKQFRSLMSQFDKDWKDIVGLMEQVDANGRVANKAVALGLRAKLNSINNGGLRGGGLSGGDAFRQSTERKLARHMQEMIMNDESPVLGGKGILTKMTDGRSMKIRSILPRLEGERSYRAVEEFVDALEGGNLLKVYAWRRFKGKYQTLTPSYWTEKALSKVHHLGLVLDDSAINYGSFAGGRDTAVFGLFKLSRKDGTPGLFGNHFKTNFNVGGTAIKAKVYGGHHFSFLKTVAGWQTDTSNPADLSVDPGMLKAVLRANGEGDLRALLAAYGNALPFGEDEIADVAQKLGDFKGWVTRNKKRFGSAAEGLDEAEFLYGFVTSLHERRANLVKWGTNKALGITRKYAGHLEKVGAFLNKFQYKFASGELPIIGKFIGGNLSVLTNLKTLIVEKGYGLLTTAISAIVGAGVLAPVVKAVFKVLGPILKVVFRKILDVTTGFFKGLLKGDFTDFYKGLNKSIDAFVKALQYAAIAPLVLVGFLFLFASVLFGSLSPQNKAVGGGFVTGSSSGGLESCGDDTITPTSCIFADGFSASGRSYSSSGETRSPFAGGSGHGSNDYWNAVSGIMGVPSCSFNIPTALTNGTGFNGPLPSNGPNNQCNTRGSLGSGYGYANDVSTTGTCGTLYVPDMGVSSWSMGSGFNSAFGDFASMIGTSGDGTTYKLVLGHLAPGSFQDRTPGSTVPGDAIAETFDWGSNSHIHIELARQSGSGWVAVRPEDFLCN